MGIKHNEAKHYQRNLFAQILDVNFEDLKVFKNNRTALSLILFALASGCAVSQSGPSVKSLGAGSDTAYLNANRGRADAQVTKDQAEQYNRQREQVKGEMDLERAKKQSDQEDTRNTLQTIQSVRGLLPY